MDGVMFLALLSGFVLLLCALGAVADRVDGSASRRRDARFRNQARPWR